MLEYNPNIDPKLVAKEINMMMPQVTKAVDNLSTKKDKTIYAINKLCEYHDNVPKFLAFICCYQGTTGKSLKIEKLTKFAEKTPIFIDNNNEISCINVVTILTDATDTLGRAMEIFFPEY